MTRRTNRLLITGCAALILGLAGWLMLTALRDNIVFFYSPGELTSQLKDGRALRLGGLVEEGSVQIDGLEARFVLSDGEGRTQIRFEGALPDLFREGQGIVADGRFHSDGTFIAASVLAKHDENYMPREVADRLKERGLWQEGAGQ
jgi:cytochrome c-type biogenesis protein CcmE